MKLFFKKDWSHKRRHKLAAATLSVLSGFSFIPETMAKNNPPTQSGQSCGEISQRIHRIPVQLPKSVAFTNHNNPSDISYADSAALRPITLSPAADGSVFLSWTDVEGSAHLTKVNPNDGRVMTDHSLGALVIRDMVAVKDGAALLYFAGSHFGVRRVDAAGQTVFDTIGRMVGTFSQIWHLGALSVRDKREEQIGVYFGVSGNQGWNSGHEGDAFKGISTQTGQVVDGGWDWGCSHSIDTRIAWVSAKAVRLCLSDVYPSAGFNIDNAYSIQPTWGTHDGHSGGRIGGFIAMNDALYFAFNKSPGYGHAESTEVMKLQNTAPFSKMKHFALGTAVAKSMKLAKLARLGANELLTGWAYADEKATVIQSLNSDLHSQSTPTRIEGSLPLARSDFQTMPNGDVIWAARDTAGQASLLLQRVSSCGQ